MICVLSCASGVLVFMTVRRYRSKKIKDKSAGEATHNVVLINVWGHMHCWEEAPLCIHSIAPTVQTRNAVVYDEVVLPPTSSSVIRTEPNAAYVTTQTTTIPTGENVAYGVH